MPKQLAFAVIGVLLFAIGFPARAEASPEYARTDLSSLAAIEAYLVSIGVDPASVVVQQGRLNYAGPDCPGADWNCTTATKVVQISQGSSPAANIFDCLPALDAQILGLNECLIVQSTAQSLTDPGNLAGCSFDGGDAKQKCKIKQSSKNGNNSAEVRMSTKQSTASPQFTSQEASIDQMSDTGNNTGKITMTIRQTLSADPTAVDQQQDASQSATVNQTANSSGSNSSSVAQSLDQDENASASAGISQKQNTASTAITGRNQEANITQQTATGNNSSGLSQSLNHHQAATGPAITQTQGTPVFSGQRAKVNQTITMTGIGVNSSTASQTEGQKQEASTTGTLSQTQIGPQDCCSTSVNGTASNFNSVVMSDVQQNVIGGTSQSSVQRGECSETPSSGASCTLDQIYTSNGQTREFGPATGTAEGNLHTCSGTTGEGGPTCTNSSLIE